jgi:hypothetical protein
MNGIIGMAELTLDSDLNRSQRESLLYIQSFARSLVCTINDISDISNRKYPGSVFRFKFVDQRPISRHWSDDHGSSPLLVPADRLRNS